MQSIIRKLKNFVSEDEEELGREVRGLRVMKSRLIRTETYYRYIHNILFALILHTSANVIYVRNAQCCHRTSSDVHKVISYVIMCLTH